MEKILGYLEEKWKQLTAFSKKEELKDKLWTDIVECHSEPKRFYHNLNHVAHMFSLFEGFMPQINQPAITGFAIFYHDIVYDTFRQDNEEQSALKAREHLQQLNINRSLLQNIEQFILATKTHIVPENFLLENDLSYFLDFDLAIVGAKWEDYFMYSYNVRKEFSQYPEPAYKEGRRHALERVANKPLLFFTTEMQDLFEETARENINKELGLLQSN